MRLAQARAEEAVIDAHARNALMFIDTLALDMPFDRAIDTYVRVMGVPEPLSSVVATRVLVELGDELVPTRVLRPKPEPVLQSFPDEIPDETVERPTLRIAAAQGKAPSP